jgi:predicted peptidase
LGKRAVSGTTAPSPHFAWGQTYENDVVIDWLFAQSRQRQ